METGISADYYTLDELYTDLEKGIWSELGSGRAIDIFRRNLQKVYLEKLMAKLKPGKATVASIPPGVTYGFSTRSVELAETDQPSVARGHLEALRRQIQAAIPRTTDRLSRFHLEDLNRRVSLALDPNK